MVSFKILFTVRSDVGMAVLDDVCTRLIRNTEEDRADELTLLRLRLLRLG